MSFASECPIRYQECSLNGATRYPFRVFVSLTVAPHRVKALYDVLPSVILPCVTFVVINIPDSYRGQKYNEVELIEIQKKFPKVYFNHFGSDLGPISKLLPTLSIAKRRSDVIICIDDDTLYTSDILIALCDTHLNDPNCVISNVSGPNIWNMVFRNVLGFTGVLYPAHLLSDEVVHTMLTYNNTWTQCKFHDDMSITMALRHHNIRIRPLDNPNQPCQVSVGLNDPGALYRITGSYMKHPACAWRIYGFWK